MSEDHTTLVAVCYEQDDGGRAAAGWRGRAGDCGTRAMAIAAGIPYDEARRLLMDATEVWQSSGRDSRQKRASRKRGHSVRTVTLDPPFEAAMTQLGWSKVRCSADRIRQDALPEAWSQRCITRTRRHFAAVVDGTLRDTWDSRYSRHPDYAGTGRMVYAVYLPE